MKTVEHELTYGKHR